jgi:hypothetical protein
MYPKHLRYQAALHLEHVQYTQINGRGYPPTFTITMPVRLRCGLGDPSFNATFLVAPRGGLGFEPRLSSSYPGCLYLGYPPRFVTLAESVPGAPVNQTGGSDQSPGLETQDFEQSSQDKCQVQTVGWIRCNWRTDNRAVS